MVDKKFSDFERVAFLSNNDLLPTEIPNTTNRAISFADFFNQIKTDLLSLSTTDCGVFKYIAWQHSGGVPIDLPKHLIYADGRTLLRSENDGLVGKFIDYIYDKQQLRQLFNIPVDKSQMTMPDLRNKHLVGTGDVNPIFSYATSKSVDWLTNISANSTTSVNNKTGLITTNHNGHQHFYTRIRTDTAGSGNSLLKTTGPSQTNYNEQNVSDLGGAHYHTIPDHNHTATTTTSVVVNKNTSLIDTINRVPAFTLFLVLDINVSGFVLNPDADGNPIIQIGDVVGLQEALDLKANLTDLTPLNNSISSLNASFLKYDNFGIKLIKTGLTTTIPSSPTAITNLTNLLGATPSVVGYATDKDGNNKTPTINLIQVTNGYKFPVINGMANYSATFNIRIFGSLSGGANTAREVVISLKRLTDNSTIASASLIETTDSNFNGRAVMIGSYVKGPNDPFVLAGFSIELLNNSGATLTITEIQIFVTGV